MALFERVLPEVYDSLIAMSASYLSENALVIIDASPPPVDPITRNLNPTSNEKPTSIVPDPVVVAGMSHLLLVRALLASRRAPMPADFEMPLHRGAVRVLVLVEAGYFAMQYAIATRSRVDGLT